MTAGSLLVAQPAFATPLTGYSATVTAAPLSLKVVFANTTPSSAAADNVSSFTAYADGTDADTTPDSSCTVSTPGGNPTSVMCYIPNLVAGQQYTVTTKARNLANDGDLAGAVATVTAAGSATTPAALTAPNTVVATATGVSGKVDVAWLPGDNTGTTVSNFTVTALEGGVATDKTCTSTSGTTYSCTVSGLTDGTAYTFQVVANGPSATVSAASTASSPATPGVGPEAPTNVVASVTAGGAATVSWTPSVTTGVTYTIAAYKDDVAIPGITCNVVAGATSTVTTGCTGTALAGGFQYNFKVTATKAGLSSAAADSGYVYILGTVNVPTSVVATGGDAEATLTWVAPTTGSTPVKYRATALGGGVTKACVTTGLTCTITGLTNLTVYTMGVVAINANGTQSAVAASAPTTVTPAVVPKPLPPAIVTPDPADVTATSATVKWTAATPVAGAAVAYYTATATPVTPAAASATALSCTAVAPAVSCVINGLEPGTNYTVKVLAYVSPTVYSTAGTSTITTDAAPPGTSGAMHGPIITNHDGLSQIFARGGDNNLYTSVQAADGTWGTWTDLSGLIFSDPVAVKNPNGWLTVFAIGGDHSIWYRLQKADGTFNWWSRLGAQKYASDIEVAQNADGTVAVFVKGTDGNLYSNTQTDAADPTMWSGWTNLSGLIFSEPVAFTRADGIMEVFAVGGDGKVWHRVQSAANSSTWNWWTHV